MRASSRSCSETLATSRSSRAPTPRTRNSSSPISSERVATEAMGREDIALDAEAAFHYETSNEFFKLWLDPTMTYSCAYFATGSESLEEAQMAKVDLAFQRVKLQQGHRLLDIGCGWVAAAE